MRGRSFQPAPGKVIFDVLMYPEAEQINVNGAPRKVFKVGGGNGSNTIMMPKGHIQIPREMWESTDKDEFHRHPGFCMSRNQLEAMNLSGIDVDYEHDHRPIGNVVQQWFDPKGNFHVIGELNMSHPEAALRRQQIVSGSIRGSSPEFSFDAYDDWSLSKVTARAISLVHDPFFVGCYGISMMASAKTDPRVPHRDPSSAETGSRIALIETAEAYDKLVSSMGSMTIQDPPQSQSQSYQQPQHPPSSPSSLHHQSSPYDSLFAPISTPRQDSWYGYATQPVPTFGVTPATVPLLFDASPYAFLYGPLSGGK